jgi:drug/metabolite transporter (DMT)-like permease
MGDYWWGFLVRFFCGGILGILLGWRVWIRMDQRETWENAWPGLVLCLIGGFVLVGTVVGLSKPRKDDFWKRP